MTWLDAMPLSATTRTGNCDKVSYRRLLFLLFVVLSWLTSLPGLPAAFISRGTHWSARPGQQAVASLLPRAFFIDSFEVKKQLGQIKEFIAGKDDFVAKVPDDVDALVDGLKTSTEASLNNWRCSRLDVELPSAFQLGVEASDKGKKKSALVDDETLQELQRNKKEVNRGNRELARIFVEMLKPIGAGLVVAFRTKKQAEFAEDLWELKPEDGKVIAFPGRSKKGAFVAEEVKTDKFKKKVVEDLKCQCLLVVAPRMEELRIIDEIGRSVQDQMGIILLNSRIFGENRDDGATLPASMKRRLRQEYMPSYHMRFLRQQRKNGLLFHMAGPDGTAPWILAQQRALVGGVKTVSDEVYRSERGPSLDDVEASFAAHDRRKRGVSDTIVDLLDSNKPKEGR
eukprot:TRINITY_DN73917_c0_g1_i1.p1 TRINITY_DN73917_c0_g1~~TRINITY_DN73917_c0_g1_i1.p1  ORF type:complete len:398 (+),score=83.03 TRINITY_DN73917_c0_g1_i1:36-1229(+)